MGDGGSPRGRWATFRFSVVGSLLACPPPHGELQSAIAQLAKRTWRHPVTGQNICLSIKTIERWFYLARRRPNDPVGALTRKAHALAGSHPSVGMLLMRVIRAQYKSHPRWTYQLHYDNLVALARLDHEAMGKLPSYATFCRAMKSNGLRRQKKRGKEQREKVYEVRSYEVSHVHALWHIDFHEGSLSVLTKAGTWEKRYLFCCIDDRSRLVCHLQWYTIESTETAVHGLQQAILKRGLPKQLMSDNGGAEVSAEMCEGLARLGIDHRLTRSRTPEQNAKVESFWCRIEGRLLPMLENHAELTEELLNTASQAWVEMEYNRSLHSELASTPLAIVMSEPSLVRPSPTLKELKRAFRMQRQRVQRRSDGTITVAGVRFEIPSSYRTIRQPQIRYCRWDLSTVDLVDSRNGKHLAVLFPEDKRRNADGRRRVHTEIEASLASDETEAEPVEEIAPLLTQLMTQYAAQGLPPAYIAPLRTTQPQRENDDEQE